MCLANLSEFPICEKQRSFYGEPILCATSSFKWILNGTVNGRNPAPPGMYKSPANNWITYLLNGAGFQPSTVGLVISPCSLDFLIRAPLLTFVLAACLHPWRKWL